MTVGKFNRLLYCFEDILGILKDDETQPRGMDPYLAATMADIDRVLVNHEGRLLDRIESVVDGIDPEDVYSVDQGARKIQDAIKKYANKAATLSTDEVYANSRKFYKNVKKRAARKLGFGEPTFIYPDELAIDRVNKLQDVFIDGHFRDEVSSRAATALKDIINESKTLSRREVGKKLMEAMPDIIKSRAYFELVAGQVLNNARSYSNMRFYQDAMIRQYEVLAVMDQRTTRQCRFMNGMVLDVGATLSRYSLYDQARTEDDIKFVNPWIKSQADGPLSVNGVMITDSMSGADLQALGLNAPPYHGGCRTTVAPVL